MGCCGEKRKQWQNQNKPAELQKTEVKKPEPVKPGRQSREFEYTGSHAMTITGVATGRDYQFRFKGDRQMVDYYDAFAMMAERDLLPVK